MGSTLPTIPYQSLINIIPMAPTKKSLRRRKRPLVSVGRKAPSFAVLAEGTCVQTKRKTGAPQVKAKQTAGQCRQVAFQNLLTLGLIRHFAISGNEGAPKGHTNNSKLKQKLRSNFGQKGIQPDKIISSDQILGHVLQWGTPNGWFPCGFPLKPAQKNLHPSLGIGPSGTEWRGAIETRPLVARAAAARGLQPLSIIQ